jgi:tRNA uridine 5-carboxymethylaminomethyl modification enzyme
MIDDLTTRGVSEPYRMFTSRAEFRLSLRADNADQRLTPLGKQLGCVGPVRQQHFEEKMERLAAVRRPMHRTKFSPKQANAAGLQIAQDGTLRTGFQLLAFPDVKFEDVIRLLPELSEADDETRRQVEREALYLPYIERQKKDIEALQRDEDWEIPEGFDFRMLGGLSAELQQKLALVQPRDLAQASRIDGMTPAALALILARLRRETRRRA